MNVFLTQKLVDSWGLWGKQVNRALEDFGIDPDHILDPEKRIM